MTQGFFLGVLALLFSVYVVYRKPIFLFYLYPIFASLFMSGSEVSVGGMTFGLSKLLFLVPIVVLLLTARIPSFTSLLVPLVFFSLSFILPLIWHFYCWKEFPINSFKHIVWSFWGYLIVAFNSGESLGKRSSRTILFLSVGFLALYLPQSLMYFVETGGRGLGRERDEIWLLSSFTEHLNLFKFGPDNFWFKMNLWGSYTVSLLGSFLVPFLLLKFLDAKKIVKIVYVFVFLLYFLVVFFNQYITSILLLYFQLLVTGFYLLYVSFRHLASERFGFFGQLIIALTIALFTLHLKTNLGLNPQTPIQANFTFAQTRQPLENLNRIGKSKTALLELFKNDPLIGSGFVSKESNRPYNFKFKTNVITEHCYLIDNFIIYGVFFGLLPFLAYIVPVVLGLRLISTSGSFHDASEAFSLVSFLLTAFVLAFIGRFSTEHAELAILLGLSCLVYRKWKKSLSPESEVKTS